MESLVSPDRQGDRSPYTAIALLVVTARDYVCAMTADDPSAALAEAIRDDDNALAYWAGAFGIDRERAAKWLERDDLDNEPSDSHLIP